MDPRMWFRRACFLASAVWLAAASAWAEEDVAELLRKLEDESFHVREQATKDLIAHPVTLQEVERMVAEAQQPETQARLRQVMDGKWRRAGWVKLTDKKLPAGAVPCGMETGGGQPLYLARAKRDGGTVIGKYLTSWSGGNFPVGEQEVMIDSCEIWIGIGTWKPAAEGAKTMIGMGKTRDGHVVYAARAKMNDGMHPGMWIEGEKEARISWGGKVNRFKDFEVLTADGG